MNWKSMVAAGTLAGALFAQPAAAQLTESVAAVVNDVVISTYDVRQRANLVIIQAGVESTPDIERQARARALQELVDENLQLQETRTFDVAITPEEIDRRLTDIARSNNSTLEGFTQTLAESGIHVSTLRHQIEADMAWQRLMSGLYGSRLRVSEQEIVATQERLAVEASTPHYLVSEIFLPVDDPAQIPQLQRGAVQLLQQMQQGVPFPAIARQFSASPSAAAGGDIGWVPLSELAPELQTVIQQLQPGAVSMPVAVPNGVYIVALRDRRDGIPVGAASRVSLRQINAPIARQSALERLQRRSGNCDSLQRDVTSIQGAELVDLGEVTEAELSEAIRTSITGVEPGGLTQIEVAGDIASAYVVCSRTTGGGGLPSREDLENQIYERDLALLSERYLRNLRREATIITR